MSNQHIFYIQLANPAAYPPICHSSRMLAELGWRVHHMGLVPDYTKVLEMPSHPRITAQLLDMPSTRFGRVAIYQRLLMMSLAYCLKNKPCVIYASDPHVTPIVVALSKLTKIPVVYHEHDLPGDNYRTLRRLSREALAKDATIRVFPNTPRAKIFQRQTNSDSEFYRVFNCPAREEIFHNPRSETARTGLIFHGSIVPARLPLTVIEALAQTPELERFTIIGYETLSGKGHVQNLLEYAEKLGCRDKINYLGPQPMRDALLRECASSHVGICLFDKRTLNECDATIPGASVKVFEYLSQGVIPVVNSQMGWEEEFINPGFAVGTDPNDSGKLAESFSRAIELRTQSWVASAKDQLETEWNYEHQFKEVLSALQSLATA